MDKPRFSLNSFFEQGPTVSCPKESKINFNSYKISNTYEANAEMSNLLGKSYKLFESDNDYYHTRRWVRLK